MATKAQVTANRANAKRSTGPKTAVGKAVVAQNAIRHGLFARQDVIAGEDPQQYQEHREGLLEEMAPAGRVETILAERIVSLTWRLKRAGTLANELFDYLLAEEVQESLDEFDDDEMTQEDQEEMRADVDKDPAYAVGRMLAKDYRGYKTLDRLSLHERRIEGSLYRTMHELDRVRRAPKTDGVHGTPHASERVGEEDGSAKQSQLAEVSNGTDAGSVCETKPIGEVSSRGQEPVSDPVKQSQSGSHIASDMALLLRSRPRVAWHSRGTDRS
jgi:hypothetical protein